VKVADEFHAAAARLSVELGHSLALRIGIDVGDVVVGALCAKGGLRSDLFGAAGEAAKEAEAAASPRQTRLTSAAQDALQDGLRLDREAPSKVKNERLTRGSNCI
jgi:hypothetical protein